MTTHILVPIDGSKHSRKTLDKACALAKDSQAKITVIQVMEYSVYAEYAIEFHSWSMEFEKAQEADFKDYEKTLNDSGLDWERVSKRGSAAHEILSYATDSSVDLIVIGNHGASTGVRFFMGSVCDKVCNHASCDVYVVK